MLIAAQFIIAKKKNWRQRKCPLKREWIKYSDILTMQYYAAEKLKNYC